MEQNIRSSTDGEPRGQAEAIEEVGKLGNPTVSVETTALYNEAAQKFDIVAVHGCGHRGIPWAGRDGGSWLKAMAVANSWETRIIQYKYDLTALTDDSYFERKAFTDEALRLLNTLVELRKRQDPPLPLVFFSHDIGGIIVKEALLLAGRYEDNYTSIRCSTHVLVFFGYPHRLLNANGFGNSRVSRFFFSIYSREVIPGSMRNLTNSFAAVNNAFLQARTYVRTTTINHCSNHENIKDRIFDPYMTTYGIGQELIKLSDLPHTDLILERDDESFYDFMKASMSRISSFSQVQNDDSVFLRLTKSQASPLYPVGLENLIQYHWLAKNQVFQRWLDKQGPSVLHIHGSWGISSVARYCMHRCEVHKNDDDLVLYFGFDKSDIRYKSIGDMSNTFLFQILNTNRDFAPLSIEDLDRPGSRNCWTNRDAFFILKNTWIHLSHLKKMYWIIDGLDQCDKSSQWFLSEIQSFAESSEKNFKVLITSYNHSYIHETYPQISSINLQNYVEMASQDIEDYVGQSMKGKMSNKPLLSSAKFETSNLLNSCKDDIRLRVLIFEWLMGFRFEIATKMALSEEIRTLSPPSPEKVIGRILETVPLEKRAWARKVIMWTLCPARPLGPEELKIAVRFSVATKTYSPESDVSVNITLELFECFGPLFALENGEIRLSHPLAREILSGNNLSSLESRPWYILDDIEDAHRQITEACLCILSIPDTRARVTAACVATLNTELIFDDRSDLVSYAIQYWSRHYRLGYSAQSNIEEFETTSGFLRSSDLLPYWAAASWYLDNPYIRPNQSFLSTLPIVASLGIGNLVTSYVREHRPVSSQLMAMALKEAARYGRRAIVQILLKDPGVSLSACIGAIEDAAKSLEIDILRDLVQHTTIKFSNQKWPTILIDRLAFLGVDDLLRSLLESKTDPASGEKFELSTPLHYAVVQNKKSTVDLFLQYRADPNMHNPRWDSTSLIVDAAKYGYATIVKRLVEVGASVETNDNRGRTALWFAVQLGQYQALQALLEAGADKRSAELVIANSDMRVFLSTIQAPFIKCLKLLLQHGINLNIKESDPENSQPLSWAAKLGRVDICRLLFEFDADLEGSTDDRPLHAAINSSQREVLDLFLEHGVNINATMNTTYFINKTPLQLAASNDQFEIAKLLLEKGADINSSDDNGYSPLFAAAFAKSFDIIKLLYDAGADYSKTYSTRSWQLTHCALESPEILEFILDKGADINASCQDGTAIYLAAYNNWPEAVDLLISRGANLEIKCEAQGYFDDNYNPLLIAASKGHDQIVRSLLEGGANVDAETPDHSTPLSLVVYFGHEQCLPVILEYNPNLGAVDEDGDSVLHCITSNTSLSTVRSLVNRGASITTRNRKGETPLTVAVREAESEASIEIIKYLIAKKADVNGVDNSRGGPLHMAAWNGNVNVLKLLLGNGADANLVAPNCSAGTPLQAAIKNLSKENDRHEAIWYLIEEASTNVNAHGGWLGSALNVSLLTGALAISKTLIAKGADINWTDDFGRLPIHYASFQTFENIQPLIDLGVNPKAKNGLGQTPFHIAVATGHLKLVEFYLSQGHDCINEPDSDGWTPILWACKISGYWNGSFSIDVSIIRLLVSNGADLWIRGKDFDHEWSPLKLARYHSASDEVCRLLIPVSLERTNHKGHTEIWDPNFHICSTTAKPIMGAYCDACLFSVYGIAYVCKTCREAGREPFALCSKCYSRKKDFHPSHSEEGWTQEKAEIANEGSLADDRLENVVDSVQRVQDDDSEGDWSDSDEAETQET